MAFGILSTRSASECAHQGKEHKPPDTSQDNSWECNVSAKLPALSNRTGSAGEGRWCIAKTLANTPDWAVPARAQVWNILIPLTHSDVFYLGLEVPFPCTLEQLGELQSPANNKIIQDFSVFSAFPDVPGWVCAHMWETEVSDALCCETSCTTVEILNCGSSNTASYPLFLFLWGEYREINDGCLFLKNKGQEHSCELHWMLRKPWKMSNFSKEINGFYNTHVQGGPILR